MQEVDVSKCIFKRGANTLTWKKYYMKSQTILIYKKIYLDLQQKAEVFIFNFFFLLSLNLAGSERIIVITFLFLGWCFYSRKVIRDFSPGVIFVCYDVN